MRMVMMSAACALLVAGGCCDCLPASVGCGCAQDDSGAITVTCSPP